MFAYSVEWKPQDALFLKKIDKTFGEICAIFSLKGLAQNNLKIVKENRKLSISIKLILLWEIFEVNIARIIMYFYDFWAFPECVK